MQTRVWDRGFNQLGGAVGWWWWWCMCGFNSIGCCAMTTVIVDEDGSSHLPDRDWPPPRTRVQMRAETVPGNPACNGRQRQRAGHAPTLPPRTACLAVPSWSPTLALAPALASAVSHVHAQPGPSCSTTNRSPPHGCSRHACRHRSAGYPCGRVSPTLRHWRGPIRSSAALPTHMHCLDGWMAAARKRGRRRHVSPVCVPQIQCRGWACPCHIIIIITQDLTQPIRLLARKPRSETQRATLRYHLDSNSRLTESGSLDPKPTCLFAATGWLPP
jgi:hypothetical protein